MQHGRRMFVVKVRSMQYNLYHQIVHGPWKTIGRTASNTTAFEMQIDTKKNHSIAFVDVGIFCGGKRIDRTDATKS